MPTRGGEDVGDAGVLLAGESVAGRAALGQDAHQPFGKTGDAVLRGRPGGVGGLAGLRGGARLDGLEFFARGVARIHDPVGEAAVAVVLDLKGEALLGFVALVAAGGAVAELLRDLGHVHEDRHVVFARHARRAGVGVEEAGVVPGAHAEDVDALVLAVALQPRERGADRALGGLVLDGHGDAVAVVPHAHHERHLQHAGGVEGLPEGALARGGVADGHPANLAALARELAVGEGREAPKLLRREREPEAAPHLPGGAAHVGADVERVGEREPRAVVVDGARGEVAVHLPAAAEGVALGVGEELREELLGRGEPERHHEGLVAVVARAPVAGLELRGEGHLRELLPVADDPELRLPRQYQLARAHAARPTQAAGVVVRERLVGGGAAGGAAGRFVGGGRGTEVGLGGFGHGGALGPTKVRPALRARRPTR